MKNKYRDTKELGKMSWGKGVALRDMGKKLIDNMLDANEYINSLNGIDRYWGDVFNDDDSDENDVLVNFGY